MLRSAIRCLGFDVKGFWCILEACHAMERGNYYYTVNTWGYRYGLKDPLVKETWGLDSIDKSHLQRGFDAQVGEFQD